MQITTIDTWFEAAGERINPILVKETRQALKSRQFSVTFLLLLTASLLVSFAGVALSGPGLNYRSAGPSFFLAYFVVLAFAAFVVVPFGAYRSLVTEHEERTFELVAITKLKPRQIIAGKLLSAIIQMVIYYSAIGPCMTFTLLLKGIDAPSIGLVLFLSVLASIGLSMVGLLFASLARRRGWQVFLSVSIIAGLLASALFSVGMAAGIIEFIAPEMREATFWAGLATGLIVFVTYFWLAFELSAARLTFDADNRSTKVRVTLVVQFAFFLGLISYWWAATGSGQLIYLIGMCVPLGLHWFVAGSFLITEPEGLSERVARSVPRSGIGRAFVSLLFPGVGTGLAFLLANLVGLVAMAGLGELTADVLWPPAPAVPGASYSPTLFALALASYIVFYCGLGVLVVQAIRRWRRVPPLVGAAFTWILAALGSIVPGFFALVLPRHQFREYRLWQITDPIATLVEITRTPGAVSLALIPAGLAVLVLFLHLRTMGRAINEIDAAGRLPRRLDPWNLLQMSQVLGK